MKLLIPRRQILKAGLAAPFILPSRSALALTRGRFVATPLTSIPMALTDARFSGNTAGTNGQTIVSGSLANKTWSQNPTYTDGTPAMNWTGLVGTDTLNMSQCAIDWREGPRIAADAGNLNIDQCFFNCVGKTGDHADGIQAFSPGGTAQVTITNTCFRSYTDAEAISKYGAGFIGSDAVFWADSFQGKISFNNCLFWGGARGVSINADVGTTHVSMVNCFFAMSPNQVPYSFAGAGGYGYLIQPTGGTLVIDAWSGNFDATISGTTITPVNSIPNPTSAGNQWGG